MGLPAVSVDVQNVDQITSPPVMHDTNTGHGLLPYHSEEKFNKVDYEELFDKQSRLRQPQSTYQGRDEY